MRRGYMRIIEVLIVLTLMFTLLAGLVRTNPPQAASGGGNTMLTRHAEDIRSMVCSSPRDRNLVLALALGPINDSVGYALSEGVKYRISVVNATDRSDVLDWTGYALPGDEDTDISTAGCVVSGMPGTKGVVVHTWF